MPPGKNFKKACEGLERTNALPLAEALRIVKERSFTKFDESVDIAVNLGVQPKYADQMVRGSCALPHGTGKQVRVLVFAKGDKVAEAREAGADHVGGPDLVQKIQDGWLDFDMVIATPDMMGQVGRLGRILGPRKLMPNPKTGSVTFDVGQAVKATKAGKINFRVEKAGIIHASVGRVSFELSALEENVESLIETLMRLRPASAKGTYLRRVTLSSTMGPAVRVDQGGLAPSLQ
jgi:large subunit ribosomal protein L1